MASANALISPLNSKNTHFMCIFFICDEYLKGIISDDSLSHFYDYLGGVSYPQIEKKMMRMV